MGCFHFEVHISSFFLRFCCDLSEFVKHLALSPILLGSAQVTISLFLVTGSLVFETCPGRGTRPTLFP